MTRKLLMKFMDGHFTECMEACRKKNADYSSGGDEEQDAFRNFRIEEVVTGNAAERAILTRLMDKWSRAHTLCKGIAYSGQVVDESLQDTAEDGSTYFGLFAAVVHEKQTNLKRWEAANAALRAEFKDKTDTELLALVKIARSNW